MRWLVRMVLFALPLALTGGCATRAVWGNDHLEAWNEPAANLNLRLYDVPARHDFLVVYTEHSERREKLRTRAYFLNENEPRLAAKDAPHFVNPKLMAKYPPVPVYSQSLAVTNAPSDLTYAVLETNGISFLLYQPDAELPEEHVLPIYNDGIGKYERAALLPPAVVVDTTVLAVWGGLICWWALGESDTEISTGR